jgi:hypothetical protein
VDRIFALQHQFGYHHDAIRMRPALARRAIAAAAHDGIPASALTHAVLSKYYQRLGIRTILEHPLVYAELATSACIELYFEPLATRAASHGMNLTDAVIRFVPLAIVIFAVALFGLVRLWAIQRDAAILLIVVLGYFTVISAGPEANDRFLVPFAPMYATAFAIGLVELKQRVIGAARS